MTNSVRKSIGYSLLSSNAVTVLQFVSSLIIARLLTPEQIGIFSVASVLVAVAQILRDMGASGYIIQVEKLTTEILRAALGVTLLAAGVIAAGFALASGAIAAFYGEPRVQDVMFVLALNFALTPFGAVTMACVRREMRFRAIAVANLFSAVISLAVSIALAYLDYGAISLAWGSVAGTLASIVAAYVMRPAYMPWAPSLKGASAILGFGTVTTSSSILAYVNMAAADLVLGKLAGMSAVAYFNRAASLNRFFGTMLSKALNPVLLPAFSEIRRNGGDVRQAFQKGTVMVTAVTWPVYTVIAVLAEPLILVLFGDQWCASVDLVPFIAMTAVLSGTYTMCGASYVALGKPGLNLIAEATNLPIKVLVIVLVASGGALAVAQAWPWIALAGAVVHQYLIRRELGISPMAFWRPLWRSGAMALLCGAGAWLGTWSAAGIASVPAIPLLAGTMAGAVTWMLAVWLVRHPVKGEIDKVAGFLGKKLRR